MTIVARGRHRALDTVLEVLAWAAADPIARHLNVRQFECGLRLVEAGEAGMLISELAEAAGVERYAASRAVEQLVALGLAVRDRSDEDRRQVYVIPTRKCYALRDRFAQEFRQEHEAA